MLVGIPLAANWYLSKSAHCYEAYVGQHVSPLQPEHNLVRRAIAGLAEEMAMMARAMYLLLLFVPAALTAPACIGLGWGRQSWLLLLRWTLEHAGGLAICIIGLHNRAQSEQLAIQTANCLCTTVGCFACRPGLHQVGAVGGNAARHVPYRPVRHPVSPSGESCAHDVGSALVCSQSDPQTLAVRAAAIKIALCAMFLAVNKAMALWCLQTSAPRHAFKHSRRIVEAAFSMPLEEVFSEFSHAPIASGSIAQVMQPLACGTAAGPGTRFVP